jgi:Methyltransferase FkbM domain
MIHRQCYCTTVYNQLSSSYSRKTFTSSVFLFFTGQTCSHRLMMRKGRDRSNQSSHFQFYTVLATGMSIGFIASSLLFLSMSSSQFLENNSDMDSRSHPQHRVLSSTTANNHITLASQPKQQRQPGWKEIHVFYGDKSHLYDSTSLPTNYLHANQWFSQFRQDELVSRLLQGKRNGYFIDLAANDAVRISNTYALETSFDWNGLCIEPNPVYWTGLSYRKCHVVAAIVGNQTMEEISFRYPRAKAPQGGILGQQFDNKSDQWNEGHPRFSVSLLDIFERFHVPPVIDYISLDIEGAEDQVMSSFPFARYRFDLMSVERPSPNLSNLLLSHGYQLLTTIKNVDTLWGHHSILQSLDQTALHIIDFDNYKYRENIGRTRIAPEETMRHHLQTDITFMKETSNSNTAI